MDECRYYLADGVRFCGQSTWLEVFRDQGRRLVIRFLPDTLQYYTAAALQAGQGKRAAVARDISRDPFSEWIYYFRTY